MTHYMCHGQSKPTIALIEIVLASAALVSKFGQSEVEHCMLINFDYCLIIVCRYCLLSLCSIDVECIDTFKTGYFGSVSHCFNFATTSSLLVPNPFRSLVRAQKMKNQKNDHNSVNIWSYWKFTCGLFRNAMKRIFQDKLQVSDSFLWKQLGNVRFTLAF